MNVLASAQQIVWRVRQRPALFGAVALAGIVAAVLLAKAARPARPEMSSFHAKRGDLMISIVEGGTIEAVKEEIIRSEVEGTARIIYIVPEGSYVKKGELLVELDSSASQDAVNLQQINVEKAQFALIQAEQQLEIQKSTVDSEVAAAKLVVEFAESDLEKYLKGEAAQLERNAQIEITNVTETLQIAIERLAWTEELFKKGFETKNNLDKDRLTVSQSRLKLEQSEKALWMLKNFDERKKKRQLEAARQEAQENFDRVKLTGERKLDQFKADVQTQKSTLELNTKKLERDLRQVQAAKIIAPQDGMVVYAGGGDHRFSSESMIEEGAVVRNRQELIKLPDIAEMKLLVKIHESHINQVRLGQPAFVVLDAMPDRRFQGEVNRVAPLPDSQSRWGNPNLKVYATEIIITEPLPNVKPGVSARAEIIITNLQQVLSVPIQAVTTRRGRQVVFLASAPEQPVPVSVGLYNIKFIEITSGLKDGDHVLLSPPFDREEKDLAGAVLEAGEKVPLANGTNRAYRAGLRGAGDNGRSRNGLPRNGREGLVAGEDGQGNGRRMDLSGREDMTGTNRARPNGPGGPGGNRPNREEMLKRFDRDGDGKLNEVELAAMREEVGRGGRRSRAATNAIPDSNLAPADALR